MTLNVQNLNTLIAHLEAQPPERINMGWLEVESRPECGTAGCIVGHIHLLGGEGIATWLNVIDISSKLALPDGWEDEQKGVRRYPAHRVISTLKRLRDHYLATGEIVVDWGPEPGSEPAQPWSAPHAIELTPPALPDEITRLLAPKSGTVGAA